MFLASIKLVILSNRKPLCFNVLRGTLKESLNLKVLYCLKNVVTEYYVSLSEKDYTNTFKGLATLHYQMKLIKEPFF